MANSKFEIWLDEVNKKEKSIGLKITITNPILPLQLKRDRNI